MQKTLLSSPLFSLVKPAVLPHSDEVRNIISLLPSCGDIDVIVVNVVIDVCAFSAAEKKREFLRKPPKVSSSSLFLPVPLHPVSSSSCHYSPDLLISCVHFFWKNVPENVKSELGARLSTQCTLNIIRQRKKEANSLGCVVDVAHSPLQVFHRSPFVRRHHCSCCPWWRLTSAFQRLSFQLLTVSVGLQKLMCRQSRDFGLDSQFKWEKTDSSFDINLFNSCRVSAVVGGLTVGSRSPSSIRLVFTLSCGLQGHRCNLERSLATSPRSLLSPVIGTTACPLFDVIFAAFLCLPCALLSCAVPWWLLSF